mmetsp:Transcript_18292/g.41606  ORF Transcript_18292/g.41606 Transcript_18292/m.41606 type:complete len:113 (+) Transcript_18292:231-569(+)
MKTAITEMNMMETAMTEMDLMETAMTPSLLPILHHYPLPPIIRETLILHLLKPLHLPLRLLLHLPLLLLHHPLQIPPHLLRPRLLRLLLQQLLQLQRLIRSVPKSRVILLLI